MAPITLRNPCLHLQDQAPGHLSKLISQHLLIPLQSLWSLVHCITKLTPTSESLRIYCLYLKHCSPDFSSLTSSNATFSKEAFLTI